MCVTTGYPCSWKIICNKELLMLLRKYLQMGNLGKYLYPWDNIYEI